MEAIYDEVAIPVERIAESVAFAMDMPVDTAINEIDRKSVV